MGSQGKRQEGGWIGLQVDFGSHISIGLTDEGAGPGEAADIVDFPYGAPVALGA